MFVTYPAIFYKNRSEEGYTVVFPDLQGCVTSGENESESMHMAQDALGAYLYEFYVDRKPMPISRDIANVTITIDNEDREYFTEKGSFASLVGIDLADYVKKIDCKNVKKTLSIPSYLNEMGKNVNINFSQVLTDALKAEFDID